MVVLEAQESVGGGEEREAAAEGPNVRVSMVDQVVGSRLIKPPLRQ